MPTKFNLSYPKELPTKVGNSETKIFTCKTKPITKGIDVLSTNDNGCLDALAKAYTNYTGKILKYICKEGRKLGKAPEINNKVANTIKNKIFDLLPNKKVSREISTRDAISIASGLQGIIKSKTANKTNYISDTKAKIKKTKGRILFTKKKNYSETTKRDLNNLNSKLLRLQNKLNYLNSYDFLNSYCLGSSQLLRKKSWIINQFNKGHLTEKEYQEELHRWQIDWNYKRYKSFTLQGEVSKSSIVKLKHVKDNLFDLTITITPLLQKQFGKTKTFRLKINHNLEQILAHYRHNPVHAQFVKDSKGVWKVHLQYHFKKTSIISEASNGMLGLDYNSDHIACVHTNAQGNCVNKFIVPLPFTKESHKNKEITSLALKKIVAYAIKHQLPIAKEDLDFKRTKQKSRSKKDNKALNSFNYNIYHTLLESKCYKAGITILQVNAEYTSQLGNIKYSYTLGSIHLGAAMVIARKAQGFTEKLPKQTLCKHKKHGIYLASTIDEMTMTKNYNSYKAIINTYKMIRTKKRNALYSEIPNSISRERLSFEIKRLL